MAVQIIATDILNRNTKKIGCMSKVSEIGSVNSEKVKNEKGKVKMEVAYEKSKSKKD